MRVEVPKPAAKPKAKPKTKRKPLTKTQQLYQTNRNYRIEMNRLEKANRDYAEEQMFQRVLQRKNEEDKKKDKHKQHIINLVKRRMGKNFDLSDLPNRRR